MMVEILSFPGDEASKLNLRDIFDEIMVEVGHLISSRDNLLDGYFLNFYIFYCIQTINMLVDKIPWCNHGGTFFECCRDCYTHTRRISSVSRDYAIVLKS